MKRFLSATLVFLAAFFVAPAHAGPMAHFELTCTACGQFGNFTRSWDTQFDASTASGFLEEFPGLFFKIDVPELGGTFYAHSAAYPNGYNFFDNTVQDAMAGAQASLIFDGPTSAPVWKVGEYFDVVNYFTVDNLGSSHLSISAVPEPESLALVGLGMLAILATRRKSRKQS